MKFSQEMELEFFARLVQDVEYIETYVDVIENYQGSSFAVEWVRAELLGYYKKYKGLPPKEFWMAQIENKFGTMKDRKEMVTSVITTLLERKSKYEEFAKEQFLDYMSSISLEKHIEEGRRLFQSSMDVSLYLARISQGLVEAERTRFGANPERVFDWLGQRKKRESRRGVISDGLRLGIKKLDEQFVFRRGTTTAFLGAYKRYKSIMLHHCGFAGMLQGYNVLHVSYENTLQQVGDRYDSRFTGVDYKRMVKNLITGTEVDVMDTVFEKLEDLPNKLKIEICKPYYDTVSVTARAIQKLEIVEGWVPDIVITDYVNLVACEKRIDDDYKRIELAVWDMQNLAKERDIICITACQALKGAEDQESLKGSDTAGSVGILRAADNQIGINQTGDEYKQGIIRLSPLHFRDDEIVSRDIPLHAELARMCVSKDSDALWGELSES